MSRRSIALSASPLLTSKVPVWRSKFIVAGLALGFVGLAGRAAYVQVIGNDFFLRQGEVRMVRTLELPAVRGRILDRNGVILATSVVAQSVWAIPESVDLQDPGLPQVAKLLGMGVTELKGLLSQEKTFVWVKRQVDQSVADDIKALKVPGIYFQKDYKRHYPEAEAVAHIVGFTGVDGKGQEGIELALQESLAGTPGSRKVLKDRLGRVVEDVRDVEPPVDGKDVYLAIDSRVQFFAYNKLKEAVLKHKAKGGSLVFVDSLTGEVIALANYPSYDPSHRERLTGEQMRNRALTDSFEPGSTMKPIVINRAMDKGIVKAESRIDTGNGKLTMGKHTISDTHAYGVLTVTGVIQKSSNVGTSKIALQMSAQDMWETYAQLGFGQKPKVPFPGAVGGRLKPYQSWRTIEQVTMSYGYGLSVSLFQLAHAYTAFARDGEVIPVSLFKATEPVSGARVFKTGTTAQVREMLRLASGPGGTSPLAQTVGYSVGGKTGTARKTEGRSYAAGKYRGFYVGISPIEQPRLVGAVMIDEPREGGYYGGIVAAPVFSETVQHTLRMMGIEPDVTVQPQIVATPAEEPV